MRRRGRGLAACAALALTACGGARPTQPNLLLITVDTLRLDRISVYGGPAGSTPSIDRLASEGIRFESVQAPRGLTWPSLTTLLTGLQPRTHQVRVNGATLEEKFRTLPEILRGAGYDTAAFLSNMCDAPNRGIDRLFCAWWEKTGPPARRARFQWASHEQADWDESITRQAQAYLRQPHARPFFAWVHYIDPHKPYDPVETHLPKGFDAGFVPDDDWLDARTLGRAPFTEDERTRLIAIYDSQVRGVDERIGRLLAALADGGLAENTLVVFTADHGEELGDHGRYFFHLCSVYQQVLALPWILRWPGKLAAGRIVQQPVAGVDITPTLLDLLGIPLLPEFEGRSRAGAARGESAPAGATATFAEWSDQVLVVGDGGWSYVWNPKRISPACLPFTKTTDVSFPLAPEELYDLARDPLQTRNVAAANPERAAALRRRGCEFLREKPFARKPLDQVAPEVKQRLESLGYLEGEMVDTGPPLDSFCGDTP